MATESSTPEPPPSERSTGVWVVLLRGVNVNGIKVTSVALRACMSSIASVSEVKTILASGNAVLRHRGTAEALRESAQRALRRDFGYDAWVVVIRQAELVGLVSAAPGSADDPQFHTYLTFASDPAALDRAEAEARDISESLLRLSDHVIAWRCPAGASTDHPLAKLLAKSRYKQSTTARNLRTVIKLRDTELPAPTPGT